MCREFNIFVTFFIDCVIRQMAALASVSHFYPPSGKEWRSDGCTDGWKNRLIVNPRLRMGQEMQLKPNSIKVCNRNITGSPSILKRG